MYDLNKNKFLLIDWRQDFAGNTSLGDLYYDLAKFMHGLIVKHQYITDELFIVSEKSYLNYKIKVPMDKIQLSYLELYEKWIKKINLDLKHVRLLCALIFKYFTSAS